MQRTLVVVLSETRAHELTFDNFKKNVIDELGADLCLCIGAKSDYDYQNPFYQLAKYRFLYDEESDRSFAKSVEYSYQETPEIPQYDNGVPIKHYTEFLKLKTHIGSENDDPTDFSNYCISTYIHIFFLWFLQKNARENDLSSKYDRFIIVRSDYIYTVPFPKMELLDESHVWIPDWEDYGGICDRAVVLSTRNFDQYISIIESFHKNANRYYDIIESQREWSMERILKMHLEETGLIGTVRRYPYISYAVRNVNGPTRWSVGKFSEELGYYIKYNAEYERALYYKEMFENYIKNNVNKTVDDFYRIYGLR
jgi:hypothetical protein